MKSSKISKSDLNPFLIRFNAINERLNLLDNTVLSFSSEIAYMKNTLASIQAKYAVSARELKKQEKQSTDDVLEKYLKGKITDKQLREALGYGNSVIGTGSRSGDSSGSSDNNESDIASRDKSSAKNTSENSTSGS